MLSRELDGRAAWPWRLVRRLDGSTSSSPCSPPRRDRSWKRSWSRRTGSPCCATRGGEVVATAATRRGLAACGSGLPRRKERNLPAGSTVTLESPGRSPLAARARAVDAVIAEPLKTLTALAREARSAAGEAAAAMAQGLAG
eukprot:2814524-Pleurochrysis_carterae.AAC.3